MSLVKVCIYKDLSWLTQSSALHSFTTGTLQKHWRHRLPPCSEGSSWYRDRVVGFVQVTARGVSSRENNLWHVLVSLRNPWWHIYTWCWIKLPLCCFTAQELSPDFRFTPPAAVDRCSWSPARQHGWERDTGWSLSRRPVCPALPGVVAGRRESNTTRFHRGSRALAGSKHGASAASREPALHGGHTGAAPAALETVYRSRFI